MSILRTSTLVHNQVRDVNFPNDVMVVTVEDTGGTPEADGSTAARGRHVPLWRQLLYMLY